MNVRDPWCLASDALHHRIVVGEIWKAPEPRAALVRRRLVTVGPGRDVGGAISQLGPAREIHVDAGAANHEVGCEYAPWRLQFDTTGRFLGGFDRRALLQMKIGVAGT